MGEADESFSLQDKRLSLIDVSFEDDSLYTSPSPHFHLPLFTGSHTENRGAKSLGFMDVNIVEDASVDSLETREEESESIEQLEGMRRNGKYNLRQSLAWDSAFFTSAGVLEPEELSSMIVGVEKGRKHTLPGIEEDVHQSTDSISTLASDSLTLEAVEADLFSDIRASIQKSSKTSNAVNLGGKVDSGSRESQTTQSSLKEDITSQNKLKMKSIPKKPNIGLQGSSKITKHVSVSSQAAQFNASNGNSTSTLCKPPKIVSKVSPILTTATKRTSLSANRAKVEKDNAKGSIGNSDKNSSGRVVKVPTLGGSRNALLRPKLPSKSSLGTNKTEKTSPSSSFDGSRSFSSESSSKSSAITAKRKIDSKTGNHSHSASTVRVASRTRNQSMGSYLSPCLKSITRLSCNISPASSISEWSSESVSPTSILNKGSNSLRPSLDSSSCIDSTEDVDAAQVLDSPNSSKDNCSVGNDDQFPGLPHEHVKEVSTGSSCLLRPDSIKPSGLRMPSPKIGFFDGVKSPMRTPTGSMPSRSAKPGGLPRSRFRNISLVGGSNEAKLGKLQPARRAMAVRSTKISSHQELKSPSPLQESSDSAPKVSNRVSRKEKCSPVISLKVQSKMSPEMGGENNLKGAKVVAYEECRKAINDPDFGFSEMEGNLSVSKDKVIPERSKVIASEKGTEMTSTNAQPDAICDSGSFPEVEKMILSHKVSEAVSNKSKEKEKGCLEDQVEGIIEQVGCINIHRETLKAPIADSPRFRDDNSTGELLKLSSPAFAKTVSQDGEVSSGGPEAEKATTFT